MGITPGAIIAGRYRADRRIGAGAMGEVWAGENVSVGYKVAIKAMLEALGDDEEAVTRFRREAFFLGRIRSDFVARVLDFAEDPKVGPVLVLDFIEGEALSDLLRRSTISVEDAIELGCDVVTGLCDLHRANIVHRDLKPSNIILEPRADGGRRAIIVDFGVSRFMKGSDADDELTNITRADMALGTLEYMAPEQMLDSRNVTGASDIYAVGAMLFRAVAGKHAFGNLADVELARNKLLNETPPLVTGRTDPVAKGYEDIIGKALRRKPADRYKRAVEFLGDLRMLRERAKVRAKEALRSMPELVDDATMDTVTQILPMDIELSASFQVERPAELKEPSSISGGRASAPSQVAPPSATVKSAGIAQAVQSAEVPASSSAAPQQVPASSAAPQVPASSARAAQPSLSSIDFAPPLRKGVSPLVVFLLVALAFGGGAALGATVLAPPPLRIELAPPSSVSSVAAAPSASAVPDAQAGAADAGGTVPGDAGGADGGDAGDAGLDAGLGANPFRDASTPQDASTTPLDSGLPYPRPNPLIPPSPGGALPGAPLPSPSR